MKSKRIKKSVNKAAQLVWETAKRENWRFAEVTDLCAVLLANIELKDGGDVEDTIQLVARTAKAIALQVTAEKN